MPDINYAKKEFNKYLQNFDCKNDKIKLKIVHTFGVVKCASEIAKCMRLSEEDRQLAEVIALLHDIGRFEQVRVYDSFEPTTMDHAAFGVDLLFGEKQMIRQFVKEDKWDDINFSETFSIIREKNYVHRLIARIPYSNPDTAKKMQQLEKMVTDYMDLWIEKKKFGMNCG